MEVCKCGRNKFKYPEGYFCFECEKTEIMKLAKKYFDIQYTKKNIIEDDEQEE